jgi:membrane fusion protein (multidrug efflux system)
MTSMASPRTISEPKSPPAAEPQPVAVPPEAKRNKAKPYVILGALVAVGLVGYGAVSWFSRGRENTDDAQVEADVVAISARVGGTILKSHVTDNQPVHKGDLLVEIDPADLTAKEKQAEAELAAARAEAAASDAQVRIVVATSKGGLSAAQAQLSGTATSVASAGAQIEAARAALAHAQAEATRADTDLARAVSLRKDEAVPQAQVDTALANAQAARAAVAQATAQLAASEDARRTAQTQIAEAKGRVEQSAPVEAQLAVAQANADLAHARADAAEASLAQAKLQLSYTRIEAPVDGLLSRLAVHEGQLVQAGQQVVGVVPDTTYVVANFKETQVGSMRAGQRAEITVDALPGRSFEGKVESTSPGTGARFSLLPADNASGNFVKVVQRLPVKIAWVNVPADVKLAAGLSVDVTVLTQ